MPASINTPFFDLARTKLGVKPRGVPPLYEPDVVARAILFAAEHPARDLAAGGAGKAFIMLKRLSPSLSDRLMSVAGFTLQKTNEEKGPDAPSNLFAPVAGGPVGPQGSFSKEARSWSLYTWWETHPRWHWAARALAVAGMGLLAGRGSRRRPVFKVAKRGAVLRQVGRRAAQGAAIKRLGLPRVAMFLAARAALRKALKQVKKQKPWLAKKECA